MTPWTAAYQAGFPVHHYLLEFAQTHVHWVTDAIQPSHPLLPPVFRSIRVFYSESGLSIRWLNYWSFTSSISPSSEYSGLISFRMDWFDLLAVQGTKSLLQHHSSNNCLKDLLAISHHITPFSSPTQAELSKLSYFN